MNKTVKNIIVFIVIFILITLSAMFVENNYNLSGLPRGGRAFIVLITQIIFGAYFIVTRHE